MAQTNRQRTKLAKIGLISMLVQEEGKEIGNGGTGLIHILTLPHMLADISKMSH
jgi:hypothetical protein